MSSAIPASPPVVWIVDDDDDVRRALVRLVRSVGWDAEAFGAAEEFLAAPGRERPGVLLLDVNMPGMTGTQLHDLLRYQGQQVPVVYLSGRGTVAICAHAMKLGAEDFLEKPVDVSALVLALERAMARLLAERSTSRHKAEIAARFARLSPREREVMDRVVVGRLNKQIAAELGIAEKTVKVHRGRLMHKVGVRSVAQLVRLCDELETAPAA
jgi:FixJ family two-component response regulator